jgi:hypothetical protein
LLEFQGVLLSDICKLNPPQALARGRKTKSHSFTPNSIKNSVTAKPKNNRETTIPLMMERVPNPTRIPEHMDRPEKANIIVQSITVSLRVARAV